MSQISDFVRRPGMGRAGRTIKVRANFFEVTVLPSKIYHYDIIITPEVPPTLNRKICAQFEVVYSESDPHRIKPAYDGRRNLFTAKPFPFGDVAVILPENDGAPTERPPRCFKLCSG